MAKIRKAQAGLTASNKRVGPVDPTGAWTRVQEENLPPVNKKTKVSLTKDKELGATKMKKGGKISKIAKKVEKKVAKAHLKSVKVKVKVKLGKEEAPKAKNGGNWIQKAVKGMRKDKPCTGPKFGSKTCPPGSKRYNLAKTFKAIGRARKAK